MVIQGDYCGKDFFDVCVSRTPYHAVVYDIFIIIPSYKFIPCRVAESYYYKDYQEKSGKKRLYIVTDLQV